MKAILIACLLVLTLGACSLFRSGTRREHVASVTGFDKEDAAKSAVPGVTRDMATKYGCTWEQIEANWNRRRMAPARAGDQLCNVLGRYGQPFSVSLRRATDMQLLSLQYRPASRYINVVAVQYDDTPANRKLKRPLGAWLIQSYGTR